MRAPDEYQLVAKITLILFDLMETEVMRRCPWSRLLICISRLVEGVPYHVPELRNAKLEQNEGLQVLFASASGCLLASRALQSLETR